MASIRTTRRLISAYADSEPWKEDHDQAMLCREAEETMVWGIYLFRDLSDLEARYQARAFRGEVDADDPVWVEIEEAYRSWAVASDRLLDLADRFDQKGFNLEGLSEFRTTVEEARCQLGLWDLEAEIRPIDDAIRLTNPENPRPDRYTAFIR